MEEVGWKVIDLIAHKYGKKRIFDVLDKSSFKQRAGEWGSPLSTPQRTSDPLKWKQITKAAKALICNKFSEAGTTTTGKKFL
jgi:hypothetical protein